MPLWAAAAKGWWAVLAPVSRYSNFERMIGTGEPQEGSVTSHRVATSAKLDHKSVRPAANDPSTGNEVSLC